MTKSYIEEILNDNIKLLRKCAEYRKKIKRLEKKYNRSKITSIELRKKMRNEYFGGSE